MSDQVHEPAAPSLFQQLVSSLSPSPSSGNNKVSEETKDDVLSEDELVEEQPKTTAVVPAGPIEDVNPAKSTHLSKTEFEEANPVVASSSTQHTSKNTPISKTEFEEANSTVASNPPQHANPKKGKTCDFNCANCHPTQSNRLEDQAATAALYVTNPIKQTPNNRRGYDIVGTDNKLSSAGAAASLKYAQPHDLPSYPSSGLRKDDSAAGAAASLGWSNQKPFEHWKPDPSSAAGTAAMLAKDYKMAPLWQPEASSNGAKAAILAHRSNAKVEIWQPEPTAWGNTAATKAMSKGNTLSPQLDYGHTDVGRKGSLLAATGAMSSSRKRAESQPVVTPKAPTYPDEHNAVANAMSAATSAHRTNSRRTNASSEAGAVPYTTMPKEMYTSHPPVAPEVDEKNRQDTLRASAVAMAKGMYAVQQKKIDAANHAASGASAAHRRRRSSASSDDEVPMKFNGLQEQAHKLAQERLSKLHDEHAQNREYRDYYSSDVQVPSSPSRTSRMSLRGRERQRQSSDTFDDDRQQSNAIRAQMSIFSNNVQQVDEKKRQQDRDNLMAVAQRNVTNRLHNMDEKVFAETGKVAPSRPSDWEVKAHAAAQANSDNRMENYGKVHIGGGKFVNQSQVDLAAQRNVQPVLDEINEKAAIQRERDAAMKAEQEQTRKKNLDKKNREREEKEINKKLKREDKEERKAREAEEKAEKRAEKERRKSGGAAAAVVPAATESHRDSESTRHEAVEDDSSDDSSIDEEPIASRQEAVAPVAVVPVAVVPATSGVRTSNEDQASLQTANIANKDVSTPISPTIGTAGTGPEIKLKTWLKSKLRRGSKSQKSVGSAQESESGFVGGAALTGASANNSNVSLGGRDSSVRDVATAKTEPDTTRGRSATRTDEPVSPLSDRDEEDEFQEARDNFDEDLAPPATFTASKEPSPARGGKFTEQI